MGRRLCPNCKKFGRLRDRLHDLFALYGRLIITGHGIVTKGGMVSNMETQLRNPSLSVADFLVTVFPPCPRRGRTTGSRGRSPTDTDPYSVRTTKWSNPNQKLVENRVNPTLILAPIYHHINLLPDRTSDDKQGTTTKTVNQKQHPKTGVFPGRMIRPERKLDRFAVRCFTRDYPLGYAHGYQ